MSKMFCLVGLTIRLCVDIVKIKLLPSDQKRKKSIGSTGEMQQWNLTVVAVPASLGATRDSLPFYTAL